MGKYKESVLNTQTPSSEAVLRFMNEECIIDTGVLVALKNNKREKEDEGV